MKKFFLLIALATPALLAQTNDMPMAAVTNGPLTTAILLRNTMNAYRLQQ